MRADRQIGLVFLFDQCSTGQPSATKAAGEVRARVVRWVRHGGLSATFAVTNPLDHPWAADVHGTPQAELALLINGNSRPVWNWAAERIESCREANLELKSAVVVGDQVSSRERRPLGLDTWAYWRPTQHVPAPIQPWRDQDGWQVPLRSWSKPLGGRSANGWWRAGQINWACQLPAAGRRFSWVFPVMTYDAGQLESCEKLLKQLAMWSRQGVIEVQNLGQTAAHLQSQGAAATQRSVLRAA